MAELRSQGMGYKRISKILGYSQNSVKAAVRVIDKEKVIHVEICKSIYVKGRWNCRIGNIQCSTERSNIDFKEVIDEIKDEMTELDLAKPSHSLRMER